MIQIFLCQLNLKRLNNEIDCFQNVNLLNCSVRYKLRNIFHSQNKICINTY